MTQTLVTGVAVLLASIAALEHVPRALTRLVRACVPLVEAWRELSGLVGRASAVGAHVDEPIGEPVAECLLPEDTETLTDDTAEFDT